MRNHDELDLGRLSDEERAEVFARFAPEEGMRLYGRGIRRRLPPMLGGDRRRIELAYSLMFSLPGTPVLRYGEEIGMGDDLKLEQREVVRTPMQWSAEKNAGFSHAPPDRLARPVIAESPFSYREVNVRAQMRETGSFLQWMQRLIRVRREAPEIGWGRHRLITTEPPAVLAHCAEWRGQRVVVLHNLGGQPTTVTLPDGELGEGHLVDLLSDPSCERPADRYGPLRLEGYGYRWLRVETRPD